MPEGGRQAGSCTETGYTGKGIETAVETHDPFHPGALHDSKVNGVARRELRMPQNDLLGSLDIGDGNRKHLIDDTEDRVEGGLDRVPALNGDVPVQDLLQHLGVRNEPFTVGNGALQEVSGIGFMRMGRPYEVHGDVRVDQNHPALSGAFVETAALDFSEHLVDPGGGKLVANRGANRGELPVRGNRGLASKSVAQGLPDPLGNGHSMAIGGPSQLAILAIVE